MRQIKYLALCQVLHQSYFTPVGIKAMAVTTTRKGITSKQLLLGTQADQVSLSQAHPCIAFARCDSRNPFGSLKAACLLSVCPLNSF